MRALIADDERAMRTLLRRMLEQLSVESVEVENGLELLALLEGTGDPDFVVIDVDMPILNGIETLRAIRSSSKYREMPVICVSGVSDQSAIRELVVLGVSDFLLKPIRPDQAIPRLRNTIKNAGRWRQQVPATTATELLLVDPDPNFLAFATPLLSSRFEILEATSATKAVTIFKQRRPGLGIVLVSEGLPMMGEAQLVETLRRTSVQLKIPPPEVYLMTASDTVDPEKAQPFNGTFRKTFVPTQFSAGFHRVVLKAMSPEAKLQSLVAGELQPELLSATQQTIGVLVGQDLIPLSSEELQSMALPIRASLILGGPEDGVGLEISIASDAASVVSISSKMLETETSIEDGAGEVLNELANTLSGRVRASLLTRQLDLQMGFPQVVIDDPPKTAADWSHAAGFRTGSGDRLMVGIRVLEGGVIPPQ